MPTDHRRRRWSVLAESRSELRSDGKLKHAPPKCDTVRVKLLCVCALLCASALSGLLRAADAKPLFNGKNLDGWEIIGDGQWTVMADGTILGQRITDLRHQFRRITT